MFEHTLSMGARGGPAEVFLRRTSAYSAEFDGDRTNGLRHDRRAELAVRVFRKGRYGLAGSSFDSLFDPIRLVRQAECQAQHGPPSPPIETPPSKGGHRGPVPPRPSELVEAIDCLRVTLCKWSPATHWSGQLIVTSRDWRVANTSGLDRTAGSVRTAFRLRARQPGGRFPFDRFMSVAAPTLADAVDRVIDRVRVEVPPEPDAYSQSNEGTARLPLILGPALVGRLAESLVTCPVSSAPVVHVYDTACQEDGECDDEGVSVIPTIPIICEGQAEVPWTTLAARGGLPATGRSFRVTIDQPPTPRPLGIRWGPAAGELPRQALFMTELVSAPKSCRGRLTGRTPDAFVWRDGRPVSRTTGRSLDLDIKDLLGAKLLGLSSKRYATGSHRVPLVAAEVSPE